MYMCEECFSDTVYGIQPSDDIYMPTMYMYMCVRCMYVFVCTCVCVCMHVCVYRCVHACVCIC